MIALIESNIDTIIGAAQIQLDNLTDALADKELAGGNSYPEIEPYWQAIEIMRILQLNPALTANEIETFLNEIILLLDVYDENITEVTTLTKNSNQTYLISS